VHLPLAAAPTIRQQSDKEVSEIQLSDLDSLLSGLHVLLVDDDQDALEVLSAALTQGQAKVTAVFSSAEALAQIEVSAPDIIVSDIAMPGEDGYQLIHKVRAMETDRLRMIPAVAITAYAREEDRERALACGYQDYLSKPVEPSHLVMVVARLASRGEAWQGNGNPESEL
jgi:CheY-like chemotaxis protein